METAELEEWFNKFWLTYPNDLCHKKKGSRMAALKALKKKKPDQSLLTHIWNNTMALIKYDHRCLNAGEKVDRWPHASTYLNQEYYDREIETVQAMQERKAKEKCSCGSEAMVPFKGQMVCARCYSRLSGHDRQAYEYLKSIGMGANPGESKHDYCMRMKEAVLHGFPEMARLLGKPNAGDQKVSHAA